MKILIPNEVQEYGRRVAISVMESMGNNDYKTSLNNYFNVNGCINRLLKIERSLKIDLRRMRILEIGSGIGMLVVVGRKLGLDIRGIEPGGGSYHENRKAIDSLLEANGIPTSAIIMAKGEDCSHYFAPNSFDLIVSFSTLEHVSSPQKVISEISLLLKPDGFLYMTCSNHRSFYENHYGIIWLPFLGKGLAKWYVRLWNKRPDFCEELYIIKPRDVRHWIRSKLELLNLYNPDPNWNEPFNTFLDVGSIWEDKVVAGHTRMSRSAQILRDMIKRLGLVPFVKKLHLMPMLNIIASKPLKDK